LPACRATIPPIHEEDHDGYRIACRGVTNESICAARYDAKSAGSAGVPAHRGRGTAGSDTTAARTARTAAEDTGHTGRAVSHQRAACREAVGALAGQSSVRGARRRHA
jgi:hypothetical protein